MATVDTDPQLPTDLVAIAAAVQRQDGATATAIAGEMAARLAVKAAEDVQRAAEEDAEKSHRVAIGGVTLWRWKGRRVKNALHTVRVAAEIGAQIAGRL